MLITGSSGLIGSEAVEFFDQRGWEVHGIDNNMRFDFFGPDGDTTWNLERLRQSTRHFTHHQLDIRHREGGFNLVKNLAPDLHYPLGCATFPRFGQDRPFMNLRSMP